MLVSGKAQNVLGSPIKSLQFLVHELAKMSPHLSLKAGELVTTGTLTEAMPAVLGEGWSTKFDGIDICGAKLRFR